jgi:hypothetical protein
LDKTTWQPPLINSENFNPRIKHIAVRYIYINDLQKKGVCKVQYLPTGNIPSDARRAHQGTLGPTEFHKHIQVLLLGQNQLTWTHTTANHPTART